MNKPETAASIAPPHTTRRLVLVMLGLVSMFNYIDRTVLSILQEPIKRELGLSDAQLGLLTGLAFALFYATLSLPIARFADRLNRRNIVGASLAIWSGMTALSGLATGFASLVTFRIGVALGEAGSVPASHSIIADYYPPARRVTAIALWGLGLPMGIMVGYASGGWIAATLGWRAAFAVIGGAGLILAPLVLLLVREPVRGAFGKAQEAAVQMPLGQALSILWKLKTYRYMLLGTTLHAFAQYSMMSWSAPFYLRVHHMTLREVASWLALMNGIGGGVGIYLGGWLSDAVARTRPAGRVWMSAAAMLIMVPAALIQFLAPSLTISLASGFVATMLMFFYYGPIVGVPQSLVIPRMRALTSAVTLLVFNLFGLGLGPTITGLISDRLAGAYGMHDTSLRYALAMVLIFSVAGALSIAWASRSYRAEMREQ